MRHNCSSDAPQLLHKVCFLRLIELCVQNAGELIQRSGVVGVRSGLFHEFIDLRARQRKDLGERRGDQCLLALVNLVVGAAHFDHQGGGRALELVRGIVVVDRVAERGIEDGFQFADHGVHCNRVIRRSGARDSCGARHDDMNNREQMLSLSALPQSFG